MYVKVTNDVPEIYTIGQLRRDNPNTSFPKTIPDHILEIYGVYPVTIKDRPETPYWQTATQDTTPTQDVNGNWVLEWNIETIPTTVEMVKAEAQRRILKILPEWKQRNLTARAAELAIKGPSNWTAEEKAEYDSGQAIWDQVKKIQIRSDELEMQDPIPFDYKDDKYWIGE